MDWWWALLLFSPITVLIFIGLLASSAAFRRTGPNEIQRGRLKRFAYGLLGLLMLAIIVEIVLVILA